MHSTIVLFLFYFLIGGSSASLTVNSSTILIPNGELKENEIINIRAVKLSNDRFVVKIHDNINVNKSKFILEISSNLIDDILMSHYVDNVWNHLHEEHISIDVDRNVIEFMIEVKEYKIHLTINSEKSYSFDYNIPFESASYITVNGSVVLESVTFGSE